MDDTPKTASSVLISQLEAHLANFVYVILGIITFIIMYAMKDSMYSKEVGLMILGWLGILINGRKPDPPTK